MVRKVLGAVIGIAIVAGGAWWVNETYGCAPQSWWNRVRPMVEEFNDGLEIAASTSRIGLGTVLLDMRENEREFVEAGAPECVAHIHMALAQGMNETINGFGYFMQQDAENQQNSFSIARRAFGLAVDGGAEVGINIVVSVFTPE